MSELNVCLSVIDGKSGKNMVTSKFDISILSSFMIAVLSNTTVNKFRLF